MKQILLSLALIIGLVATVKAADEPKSIVRVYIYIDNDVYPDIYGSGALISPTQVLTNWHVVEKRREDPVTNSRSVQVRFYDGSRSYAAVVFEDKEWDIALLQIHPTEIEPFHLARSPKRGDKVYINGFGYDYEYRCGEGTTTIFRGYPYGIFRVDGYAAYKGDSGGPVTNFEGKLVGVLNASDRLNNRTYGINIDRIAVEMGALFKPTHHLGFYSVPDSPVGSNFQLSPDDDGPFRSPFGVLDWPLQ
jgi:S1-C subfamily serine protease